MRFLLIFLCIALVCISIMAYGKSKRPPQIGDKAPLFALPDQSGQMVELGELLKGVEYLVLVFYPKDGTPGCTAQLCALRDLRPQLPEGVKIVAISSDDTTHHEQFAQKHGLPFPLLSDTKGTVRSAYGAYTWGFIPARVTFIINHQGCIIDQYRGLLSIDEHIERVRHLISR